MRRRSIERGRAVADAVFDWSRDDGGHEVIDHIDPSFAIGAAVNALHLRDC